MIAAGLATLALLMPVPAHPLGNFTVNQYAGLHVSAVGVDVDYVLDLAELPAFQTREQDIGSTPPASWAAAECGRVAASTTVDIGSGAAAVTVLRSTVSFPAGQGGLATLRLECGLRASSTIDGETEVAYRSDAYADRIGWREVTAAGDGVRLLRSSVPDTSVSGRLTAYPTDVPTVDVRTATLRVRPGGAVSSVDGGSGGARSDVARGVDRFTLAFTELVGRPDLTLGLGLLALLLALVLGAAHAFAPGHGKTVLAAYLVGERGSLRHALVVAGTVTATHTAGVLVLGLVLTTSLRFAPDRLYAWLGVLSGLLLAGVGAAMLRRARRGQGLNHHHHHGPGGHTHDHGDAHDHGHGDAGHGHDHADAPAHAGHGHTHAHDHGDALAHAGHGHAHDQAAHDHGHAHDHAGHGHGHDHAGQHGHGRQRRAAGPMRLRSLVTMGFAGGLAPSPSAVVVLLGAIALGRTWFGVLLVLGYGIGMAAALILLGLALARWRGAIERRTSGRVGGWLRRGLPLATSSLVLLVGMGLAARSALGIG